MMTNSTEDRVAALRDNLWVIDSRAEAIIPGQAAIRIGPWHTASRMIRASVHPYLVPKMQVHILQLCARARDFSLIISPECPGTPDIYDGGSEDERFESCCVCILSQRLA